MLTIGQFARLQAGSLLHLELDMLFGRRKKADQYWQNRELDFFKARVREASFFLLAFAVVLGVASWWITQ